MSILPALILMLGVIGMISFLAQKVAIPAPVLLAASGVAWSLIPSLPSLEIAPPVILSVFLPPLLYADAWQASWIDFRRLIPATWAPKQTRDKLNRCRAADIRSRRGCQTNRWMFSDSA